MHHLAMRTKGLALLILATSLLFSSSFSANADVTPTPTPSPDYQMLMDQYKIDMNQYRIVVEERDRARGLINRIFMDAVDMANRDARAGMKIAKTPSAKADVIAKQKNAIKAASDARDVAISALGALPTPPVKPVRQVEMAPLSKMKTQKPSPSSTRKSKN